MSLPAVQAAVDDLRLAHRELLRVVDSLSVGDWERPVPYGQWTVKDLVAHTIGDMSPSWPGFILAGVLTPQFIVEMGKGYDARTANADVVEERRRLTREDLRQMLFEAHDSMMEAALRLDASHQPVLDYVFPMGPEYDLRIEDLLWRGAHDRQHSDDIRRSLEMEYAPEQLSFIPEIERKMRWVVLSQETFLRAVYSVADDGWNEEAACCPGWTYHDIAAHVASNEARLQIRLLSAMGEASESDLAAVNQVDEWNAEQTAERRGRSVEELADEFIKGRYETIRVLSRFTAENIEGEVTLGGGEKVAAQEFIRRLSMHTSRHAGQLVAASRARKVRA